MAELAHIETVVALQGMDLLAHCKAEEILRIAAIASEHPFAAGDTIYRPQEPADRLYFVVRGAVRLSGADGAVQRLGPLQSFGVMEILSGRLRTEEARAESPSLMLACEAEDFFDLLSNNIEMTRALFRYLLQRPGARPEEQRDDSGDLKAAY